MTKRKKLTPKATLVLLALSDEKQIDSHIRRRLESVEGAPRTMNGIRRILRNLVKDGYASVTRFNGSCDYWWAV